MANPHTKPADSIPSGGLGRFSRGFSIWPSLALAALILATFWPVLAGRFTTWDDNANLAENADFRPVTWRTPVTYLLGPHMHLYVPLTYAVWSGVGAMDQFAHAVIAGEDPAFQLHALAFHLANLLLHLATTLVVYAILKRLLGGGGARSLAAWLGAALFAVHPVQVEAVGWVSGLKDVLCGLLIWTAILRYLIFVESDQRIGWNAGWATLAFIAALLAKPTAMVAPAIALLLQLVVAPRSSWRRAVPLLAAWFILSAGWALVTHWVQPPAVAAVSMAERPLVAADAIAFYVYKLVVPLSLTNDYGRYPAAALAGPAGWTWLIPAALAVLLLIFARRRGILLVAAGMFLLPLLPVLGFVPFDFQQYSTVADHYLYPAMAGVALIVAWAVARAPGRAAVAICGVVVAGLAGLSCLQSFVWRDSRTLFEHTLKVNPRSWAGYNTLANLDREQGRLGEALALSGRSLELAPPCYAKGYATKAGVLMDLGDLPAAEAAFRQALDCEPGNASMMATLAAVLAKQKRPGDFAEATKLCHLAIAREPGDGTAYINLANILIQQDQFELAGGYLIKGVSRKPDDVGARVLLARWFIATGQRTEAIRQLHAAVALEPKNTAARGLLEQLGKRR